MAVVFVIEPGLAVEPPADLLENHLRTGGAAIVVGVLLVIWSFQMPANDRTASQEFLPLARYNSPDIAESEYSSSDAHHTSAIAVEAESRTSR